jgi:hypothetical protein
MCYVLSHSSNFRKYLNIENMNFSEYCEMLSEKYKESWNTDENFMYDQFKNYSDKLVIKSRELYRRVDRGNWRYDVNLLKSGFYIDSHMLRPYNVHKEKINQLICQIEKI